MMKRLTALKLALVLVFGLALVGLTAAPAEAACDCYGTTMICIVVNPDGSIGGWIRAENHPKCIVY